MQLPEELRYIQNSFKAVKTTNTRLDGKVCVISGTTSGVGYQAARCLAEGGAHLVMICRNEDKARVVQAELKQDFNASSDIVIADLQYLSQVAHAAQSIAAAYPQIHILINNAGLFNKRHRLTPDGYEMTFGVIHLASFLLTHCLLDNLKQGQPARVIDINSEAHRFGGLNLKDLDWKKRPYIGLRAYGAAKIAQILTAQVLAEVLQGSAVTVNLMHPGAVRTNIGMNNPILYRLYNRYLLRWFLKDPTRSGKAIYYLAAAPELQTVSGQYFNMTTQETAASYILKDRWRQGIYEYSMEQIKPYLEGK